MWLYVFIPNTPFPNDIIPNNSNPDPDFTAVPKGVSQIVRLRGLGITVGICQFQVGIMAFGIANLSGLPYSGD